MAAYPTLILAACVGLIYAPIPFTVFGSKTSEQDAKQYIGQLWQVSAAAVALSIAVVVFALQMVSAARSSNFRELARAASLTSVVYAGVAAILVQGIVLLGFGIGSAQSWAGTWGVILAMVSILLVAYLFASALRAIDPKSLRRRRIARISKELESANKRKQVEQIALQILRAESKVDGRRFTLYSLPNTRFASGIFPVRGGEVIDIRLSPLRRLARVAHERGVRVEVSAQVGTNVSPTYPVIKLEEEDAELRLLARQIVVISGNRAEKSGLSEALEEVHEEALQAIHGAKPSIYSEVREFYEELLDSIARSSKNWHDMSGDLDLALQSFASAPVELVIRNIREEVLVAVRQEQREITFSSVYIPFHVVNKCLEHGAFDVAARMYELVASLATIEGPQGIDSVYFDNLILNLSNHLDYVVAPRLRDHLLDASKKSESLQFAMAAHDCMASIMRYLVDARRPERFFTVHTAWVDVMDTWLSGGLVESSRDGEGALVVTLHRKRSGLHFALLAWILRALETERTAELAAMFQTASGLYDDMDQVIQAAICANDDQDRVLSRWILFAQTSRRFVVSEAHPLLIRATAILLLRAQHSSNFVQASPWIADSYSAVWEEVKSFAAQDILLAKLSIPEPSQEALDRICDGLTEAAEQQKASDAASLIAAPLDVSRIDVLKSAFFDEWTRNRVAFALMDWKAAVRIDIESETTGFFTIGSQLDNKTRFTEGSDIDSARTSGSYFGKAAANAENAYLASVIRNAETLDGSELDGRPPLEIAIGYLIERGYSPSVIIGSNRHRLESIVESSYLGEVPSVLASRVLGVAHGLPIVELWSLPGRTLYVCAFDRWAEWIQGNQLESAAGLLEVSSFSVDSARDLLESQPELLDGLATVEERAAALQQQVRIDFHVRFKLDNVDTKAIIGVKI
jgi:hypothetical protein